MKPIRLVKGFLTVGSWTFASRLFGFIRDMMIAAYLGSGPVAEAFLVAFSLPNMFRRFFAEGAFNMAFVPMFSKKLAGQNGQTGDRQEAERFASDAFSMLGTALIIFTIVGTIAMPVLVWAMASGFIGDARFDLAVEYGRIAFSYILFISLVALLSGVLNSFGSFTEASFVPVLMNIMFIASIYMADHFGWDMGLTLAWTVPVTGIAQLTFTWFSARRLGFRLVPHWPRMTPDLKRLMIIAGPAVLSGGVVQINLLVGRQVASFTDGAVAWLSYADRLYQLPLGVVAIAIGTVLLPALSRHLRDKDDIAARETFSRGMEFALFLTFPAAVALVIIADPLVSVLYGRGAWSDQDTYGTSLALAAYGIGLPAFVLHKVLQPLYYAREDSRSPFRFALISMVVNVVFAVALQPIIGFLAAALATTVSGWVMVIQLWLGARKMGSAAHPDARFWARFWRILVASAVMGVALWGMAGWLGDSLTTAGTRYGALAALCGVGIAVYFLTAGLIGAFGLGEFKKMLRRQRT